MPKWLLFMLCTDVVLAPQALQVTGAAHKHASKGLDKGPKALLLTGIGSMIDTFYRKVGDSGSSGRRSELSPPFLHDLKGFIFCSGPARGEECPAHFKNGGTLLCTWPIWREP